jgi:hypothetical protein
VKHPKAGPGNHHRYEAFEDEDPSVTSLSMSTMSSEMFEVGSLPPAFVSGYAIHLVDQTGKETAESARSTTKFISIHGVSFLLCLTWRH